MKQVLVITVDYEIYCGFFLVPVDALVASYSLTCQIKTGLAVIELRIRLGYSQHEAHSYVRIQLSVTYSFHIFPGTCLSLWQLHCVNLTLSSVHRRR